MAQVNFLELNETETKSFPAKCLRHWNGRNWLNWFCHIKFIKMVHWIPSVFPVKGISTCDINRFGKRKSFLLEVNRIWHEYSTTRLIAFQTFLPPRLKLLEVLSVEYFMIQSNKRAVLSCISRHYFPSNTTQRGVTVQNITQNDFCSLHLLSMAPANSRNRDNTKPE